MKKIPDKAVDNKEQREQWCITVLLTLESREVFISRSN